MPYNVFVSVATIVRGGHLYTLPFLTVYDIVRILNNVSIFTMNVVVICTRRC